MNIQKQNDKEWLCFNDKMEVATIVKCEDNRKFGSGTFYRVDGNDGKTIETLIKHFQTAKAHAKNYLNNL